MTELKPYRQTSATAKTLRSATEARIHKLVLRTLQYNFGVEPALRRAVELGACEMLEAGASVPAVRQAIARCVLSHPSVLPDKLSLMTGESHAAAILTRMLAWTDDVVTSHSPTALLHTDPSTPLRVEQPEYESLVRQLEPSEATI